MQYRSRILVTGSSGNLGRLVVAAVKRRFFPEGAVIATLSRRRDPAPIAYRVDITDRVALSDCLKAFRPTTIIHLAALSSPSEAHRHPDLARATNVDAVETLAAYAAVAEARLVFTSSDYVFDGTLGRPYREADLTEPETVYGQTKLSAEGLVRNCGGVVARLSLLHERGIRGTALQALIGKAKAARHPVQVAEDEVRSPVRFSDAAAAIVKLAFLPVEGVFHVSGPERLSPMEIVRRELLATTPCSPISRISRCALMPPERPADVSLESSKLRGLCPELRFGSVAPPIQAVAPVEIVPETPAVLTGAQR